MRGPHTLLLLLLQCPTAAVTGRTLPARKVNLPDRAQLGFRRRPPGPVGQFEAGFLEEEVRRV